MITVAVIGLLVSVALVNYQSMLRKAEDASTFGNLGSLRSALSIYYGENEQFPRDGLESITAGWRYLQEMAVMKTTMHSPTTAVTTEAVPSEAGRWSYSHNDGEETWGKITVGCLHRDTRGVIWSSY